MSAMLTDPEPKSELRFVRIMLRSPESASSSAKSMLISKVKETVKEFTARPQWQSHFKSGEKISGYVTGYYLLLAKLVESLLADQWICFLVATVCIGLMLWIALGDWWLALASLVPNMLPIFLVWGIMGWLGYRVDMGAVMIAAVSIGLSIDGSIHYLLRAQREEVPDSELCDLNRVISVSKTASETQPTQQDSATVALTQSVLSQRRDRQLRAAQRSTGVALMVATLALVLGFLSLAVSDFRPTVTFGTLVSLTMIGGLVGNLVILPILVAPWKPRRTTSRI
jgi:predicted RND superfamily exporter protein